jgi:peptidoglycan/LPS O-acetylase OafA/YrhL
MKLPKDAAGGVWNRERMGGVLGLLAGRGTGPAAGVHAYRPQPVPESRPSYIRSLDGLRGLSILLVLLYHWHYPIYQLPFGWTGVQVFFVLSGFLITRILLPDTGKPLGAYLKRFYVRRVLRIFPIYYLYIAFLAAAAAWGIITPDRSSAVFRTVWQTLTYTYNYYNVVGWSVVSEWQGHDLVRHLWSLCVEEQFYLFFPFIVYACKPALRRKVIIAMVFFPILLRILVMPVLSGLVQDSAWVGSVLYTHTLFQMDSLALGAAMAVFNFDWVKKPAVVFVAVLAGAAAVGLVLCRIGNLPLATLGLPSPECIADGRYIYQFPIVSLVSASALLACTRGTFMTRIFENRALVEIGRVSYGVYLYHMVVKYFFVGKVISRVLPIEGSFWFETLGLIAYLGAAYGVAYLSHRFIEQRFLALKDKFGK